MMMTISQDKAKIFNNVIYHHGGSRHGILMISLWNNNLLSVC